MVAATQDRNTKRRAGVERHDPMGANQTIYAGTIVCLDAAGNAVKGAATATLKARGIAVEQAVNGAGIGESRVRSRPEEALLANSAGADEITRADIGGDCFIADDQTVAKTNGGNTRPLAGKVVGLDGGNVWVRVGI